MSGVSQAVRQPCLTQAVRHPVESAGGSQLSWQPSVADSCVILYVRCVPHVYSLYESCVLLYVRARSTSLLELCDPICESYVILYVRAMASFM